MTVIRNFNAKGKSHNISKINSVFWVTFYSTNNKNLSS